MGLNDHGAQKIVARPLEFIFMLDVSGSMAGSKIESLNFAIAEAIPEMRRIASENVNAEVFVRVLTFGSYAKWHIGKRTLIDDVIWKDVKVDGSTMMGAALSEVATVLDEEHMPQRGLPPVIVLVSDGQPTDSFETGLQDLLSQKWGQKAVKIAIAIGDDANHDVLKRFVNDVERPILQANNASELVNFIRFTSTKVLSAASKGRESDLNKELEEQTKVDTSVDDVW